MAGYAAGPIALPLVAGAISLRTKNDAPTGPSISVGYVEGDQGRDVAYLWQEILKGRGYRPKVQAKSPHALFAAQAEGHIDVQHNARLAETDLAYWQRYNSKLEGLGTRYNDSSLNVAVPKLGVHFRRADRIRDFLLPRQDERGVRPGQVAVVRRGRLHRHSRDGQRHQVALRMGFPVAVFVRSPWGARTSARVSRHLSGNPDQMHDRLIAFPQ
ncbi:glycine betaine ABC transporter substrate-binding protein [Streptomyces sp. NPDC053560]|uniref:glycine betaine ABC transporter substrate-binding protein n=1 Tax=Streptomyces sp. NPDC053560 TaxID=3365711 RepID=UPI0037D72813